MSGEVTRCAMPKFGPEGEENRCGKRTEGGHVICHACIENPPSPERVEDFIADVFVPLLRQLLMDYRIFHHYAYELEVGDGDKVSGGADYSDPTLNSVLGGAGGARVRTHLALATLKFSQAYAKLRDEARKELGRCERALRTAEPGPEHDDSARPTKTAPGGQWCANCLKFDIHEPEIYAAARCRPCYEYRRRHDLTDAPESVIREREWIRASRFHEQNAS